MPISEVILIENIPGLGAEADVVKVKAGYARNFLLPRGKAYEVTPVTLKKINLLKAKRAEREAQELNDAQELARKINKLKVTLTLETGVAGKAFGSITAKDLADKLKAELGGSTEVDRHRIQLDQPIKSTGEFTVPVKLHSDVTANFQLTVKSANEEPEAKEEAVEEQGYKAKPKARHTK